MKNLATLLACLFMFVLIIGCNPPGADLHDTDYPEVTQADVATGGEAFSRALSAVSLSSIPESAVTIDGDNATIEYHSADGKVRITGSITGLNSLSETIHEVATLSGLNDPTTGYLISGTITFDMAMSFASLGVLSQIATTETADLSFTGSGPVRKLTIDLSITLPYNSGVPGTPIFTGTVTCNGHAFDPSDLVLQRFSAL